MMNTDKKFWFTIEPYVYVGLTDNNTLLYNTLDREFIESDKTEIINLLKDTFLKENNGVLQLSNDRYNNKNIKDFIIDLKAKFMGDIIDSSFSKVKPIQILPYFNISDSNNADMYKLQNFTTERGHIDKLSEISIYMDKTTNAYGLISALESVPAKTAFNLIGDIFSVNDYDVILSFLNNRNAPKNIICSYIDTYHLGSIYENNFSYTILVDLPINSKAWNKSIQISQKHTLSFEYIFHITSENDYELIEQIIEDNNIKNYSLEPLYTGENIAFLKDNVFLKREDILAEDISVKSIFINQMINIYDFGKLNIMPNGDVFANINYPILGNIYKDSFTNIINKEIKEGKSWFRTRTKYPCNGCVFQWLCPSPSNLEIAIGYSNLCHIKDIKHV